VPLICISSPSWHRDGPSRPDGLLSATGVQRALSRSEYHFAQSVRLRGRDDRHIGQASKVDKPLSTSRAVL
jgi:hypothetical protein